ncbi:predicted protein [Streptomyces viridosporus ATCC 14672]|uniref:Predicted protein n=1 Tax=Streptomyces viridosporus (strain ATCC 14672 / DSM 40746 / JCM 4963 / KCTC 9882 / NRRL B-12104 / FH 1290) TaxID=566461 RepID=D5ZNY7_STRV1|nr:predicted protein [Streptomyces viridosporus ATCC 14672]
MKHRGWCRYSPRAPGEVCQATLLQLEGEHGRVFGQFVFGGWPEVTAGGPR